MRPSQPGPAQEGVTTHELLPLLGMTFRTDTTIDRVEPGRLLQWRAPDRQKQLHGSRLVEPTGPASCRFTEVVEGHLLGPSRVLEPLVAWLLQRQATSDLGRLKHLLETSTVSGSAPPVPTHWPPWSQPPPGPPSWPVDHHLEGANFHADFGGARPRRPTC